jgi:copper(I)-binding protein
MRGKIRVLFGLLSLLLAAPLPLPTAAADKNLGDLKISQAWSRSTPKLARAGVGYLTIQNDGDKPDRLISVVCSCAENTGMHETKMANGMMQMVSAPDGIIIPAHQTVVLKPSGKHFMFMGLRRQFVSDETFNATLTFEVAGTVDISFEIKPLRRRR